MKSGGHKSIAFTPPRADVRDMLEVDRTKAAAVPDPPKDPQESVLLYGHMLTDAEILTGELRGLLFSGADYRSRLRVVRSAALRLSDRAAKLLGEEKA